MHSTNYFLSCIKQNVLPLSRQLKSFMHYKLRLTRLMGKKNAGDTIRNALFVMSMGTNDFIQNYYLEPTRPKQFTVEQYQNYLVSCMAHSIQVHPIAVFLFIRCIICIH